MPANLKKKSSFSFLSLHSLFLVGIGILVGAALTLLVQQSYANNLNPKNKSNTFLSGTVYSATGGVISRAKVGVLIANQTFTDSSGKYVLAFPYGSYNVVVHYSAKGYIEQTINTSLVGGTTVNQDVTLQKIN